MTDEQPPLSTDDATGSPLEEEEIVVPPRDEEELEDMVDAGSVEVTVPSAYLSRLQSSRYGVSHYFDHFSLPLPSSTIRFRSSSVSHRVYEGKDDQFVLEQDPEKITVKKMKDGSTSLMFLRAVYSLQCLFFAGFLVAFAVQILLFLIMDLTIDVGLTSEQPDGVKAVGVILSLPVYVFGLASALVLAGAYTVDTWGGSTLVRTFVFSRYSEVVTSWLTFVVFLAIPLLVMAFSLFAGSNDWWSISLLTWFGCICLFYVFFCAAVVSFEMYACLEVMKNQFEDDKDDILSLMRRSILLRQVHSYGGVRSQLYLARGTLEDPTSPGETILDASIRHSTGLYSKFTVWRFTSWIYNKLDEPGDRIYTIEDARGLRPFITRHTWSLEKLYCRERNSRYVAVIDGPAAVTRSQMRSNVLCVLIGNLIVVLIIASFLAWLDLGWEFILIVLILVAIFAYPSLKQSYRISNMTKDLIMARNIVKNDPERAQTESDESLESSGLFQVWDSYRISKPAEWFCWTLFFFEVILFFIWPFVSLLSSSNWAIATLFFFVAFFTFLRYYFNAAIVLEEVGNLDYIKGKTELERWKKRARVNEIVGSITRGSSMRGWLMVLCLFLFVFFALFLGAVAIGQQDTSSSETFQYQPGFFYEQQEDLPYPTCIFGKGLEGGLEVGNSTTGQAMADYVYLAGLAYRSTNVTQGELNEWFGTGVAQDNPQVVSAFREENNFNSPVTYKLITFGSNAIIAIRGTTSPWDALADAQLWSGAACFQIVRFILPFGQVFTPIFDELVNIISWLESDSIARISFYKETTAFAESLKSSPSYTVVQVTGHSLGGGLSIITGAQANIPAIALSGPNSMISRRSFDPPVSVNALDTLTFNIIPERDVVPMFDDRASLYQNIKCRAPFNDFIGCHDSTRSLCEVLTTCGTQGRPTLCECVYQYGFDPPEPLEGTNVSFAQACGVAS